MSFRHAALLGARLLGMFLVITNATALIDAAHEAWQFPTRSNTIGIVAICIPFLAGLVMYGLAPSIARRLELALRARHDEERRLTYRSALYLGATLIGLRTVVVYVPGLIISLQELSSPAPSLFPSPGDVLIGQKLAIISIIFSAEAILAAMTLVSIAPRLTTLSRRAEPSDLTESI